MDFKICGRNVISRCTGRGVGRLSNMMVEQNWAGDLPRRLKCPGWGGGDGRGCGECWDRRQGGSGSCCRGRRGLCFNHHGGIRTTPADPQEQRDEQKGNQFSHQVLLRSQIRRNPSSVNQGARILIEVVSSEMVPASPPVAMTFMSGPNSVRKRSTIPSTMLT